jgi:hypothetical protein
MSRCFPAETRVRDDIAPVEPKEIDWDVMAKRPPSPRRPPNHREVDCHRLYVVKKLVDTTCQIAVIAAKAKLK